MGAKGAAARLFYGLCIKGGLARKDGRGRATAAEPAQGSEEKPRARSAGESEGKRKKRRWGRRVLKPFLPRMGAKGAAGRLFYGLCNKR